MSDTLELKGAPQSGALSVSVDFIHDQEPPEEWVRELKTISDRNPAHGWLLFCWEPGEPWAPIQRWALYDCIPPERANPLIVSELRGPNPRSEGHMCSEHATGQFQCLCQPKLEGWRGGPCAFITLTQWKLFQRTGLFGQPFWIIQGERGGHKSSFTTDERVMLGDAGLPDEPPYPGELPYAPFDQRTIQQFVTHNKLLRFQGDLRRFKQAMGPGHAQYVAEQERQRRIEMVKWLSDGFLGDQEDVYRSAVGNDDVTDLMPRKDFDIDAVADDVEETFIETGRAPDPEMLYRLKYGT